MLTNSTFTFLLFLYLKIQCLPHGWYMSADFQLYMSSFLVLPLLYKSPKKGLLTLFAIIFGGFILQIILPIVYGTSPQWRMDTLDFYKVS